MRRPVDMADDELEARLEDIESGVAGVFAVEVLLAQPSSSNVNSTAFGHICAICAGEAT
jgi:hypothetical protein